MPEITSLPRAGSRSGIFPTTPFHQHTNKGAIGDWLLNKLVKLKRREFRRRKGLEELVDVHKRFLDMLRVLRDLWRHEIFRLTHLDDNSSADDLVCLWPRLRPSLRKKG